MDEGDGTEEQRLAHTPGAGGKPLQSALYFVSTPIGAARDITLRGLDVLRSADVLAAEDTRTLRHLMEIHGIALNGRPLIAYHDHNGEAARPRILRALGEGLSVAYASEAGTPLVADPGFQLGRAAIAEGFTVLSAPGASAVLAALTVSGLPTDRFLFAGFAPTGTSARRKWLREFAPVPATLIFYESPKRIGELLGDLVQELGAERQAAVCRELTKRFEDVRRGSLRDLHEEFLGLTTKGEIVVLVDRPHGRQVSEDDIDAALMERLDRLSVKDAATEVASTFDLPRRDVYQRALKLARLGGEEHDVG